MPIYEYGCLKCGAVIERLEKNDHLPLSVCPTCQGEMKRLISMTAQPVRGNTTCCGQSSPCAQPKHCCGQ